MAATNMDTHTNTDFSASKDERRPQGGSAEANGSMNGGLNGMRAGPRLVFRHFSCDVLVQEVFGCDVYRVCLGHEAIVCGRVEKAACGTARVGWRDG